MRTLEQALHMRTLEQALHIHNVALHNVRTEDTFEKSGECHHLPKHAEQAPVMTHTHSQKSASCVHYKNGLYGLLVLVCHMLSCVMR